MLIYDEPLLSGQPPLSGHLPVPEGGRIMKVAFFLISTADVFFKFPHPHPALKTANGLFTFFVANCEKKKLPKTTKTITTTTTLYYTENSTAPPPIPPLPSAQHRHTLESYLKFIRLKSPHCKWKRWKTYLTHGFGTFLTILCVKARQANNDYFPTKSDSVTVVKSIFFSSTSWGGRGKGAWGKQSARTDTTLKQVKRTYQVWDVFQKFNWKHVVSYMCHSPTMIDVSTITPFSI